MMTRAGTGRDYCPVARVRENAGTVSHPDLAGIETTAEARGRRLRSFRANIGSDDAQVVAAWRERSAAEHAAAGAELSDMAARMAAQTGRGKSPELTFPRLSSLLRDRGPVTKPELRLLASQKVLALRDALEEHAVPYAFGGAIALFYCRDPRSTIDIDDGRFERWRSVWR